MMFCPSNASVREPSSSVGSPNMAGSGAGWSRYSAVIEPVVADERDELRHRRTEPVSEIRLVDVTAGAERFLAIRDLPGGRRLVRDEDPDLLRMPGHQGQGVHRTAAGGEQVHRPGVQLRDQPVQVVRVLIRGGLAGAGRPSGCVPRRGGRR